MYTGGFAKTFWNLNFLNVNGYPSFNTIRPPSTSGAYLKKVQNNAALSYVYFVFFNFFKSFPIWKMAYLTWKTPKCILLHTAKPLFKKNDIKSDLAALKMNKL